MYFAVKATKYRGQWDSPAEHREDQLPVAVGRAFVVDVAVGQRVTVLGASVEFVAVLFLAVDKPDFELLIKQRFRRQILVCKAEVKFLLTVRQPRGDVGPREVDVLVVVFTARGDRWPSSGRVMVCAAQVTFPRSIAMSPARRPSQSLLSHGHNSPTTTI